MKELELIFTEMLKHIEEHEEIYKKWSKEVIVKTWILAHKKHIDSLMENIYDKGFNDGSMTATDDVLNRFLKK